MKRIELGTLRSKPILGLFLRVSPFPRLKEHGKSHNEDMHPLLLGTLIFFILGLVSTIIVLILYKAKVMSRVSAEYIMIFRFYF